MQVRHRLGWVLAVRSFIVVFYFYLIELREEQIYTLTPKSFWTIAPAKSLNVNLNVGRGHDLLTLPG